MMHYFIKLNIISMLYAVVIWFPLELILNTYRISRWLSSEVNDVQKWMIGIIIVELIVGSILIINLSKRWLTERKANFWTLVLWIPYFILLIYHCAVLFPVTNEGDTPSPVTGLFLIGGFIVYPVYILILNAASITKEAA